MLTVLNVIGTRPEAIKMAPVVAEMDRHREQVRSVVCVTGQHREMLDQALAVFGLRPDYDLDMMRPDQSLTQLTARLLDALDGVIRQVKPDWILAQGDTTSAMVTSLVAFYHRIPFGHVEAGLRTTDPCRPFPEEINRRLADTMATLLFAPTERARQTLLREGRREADILLTGNTVIDALQQIIIQDYDWVNGPLSGVPCDRRLVLVTMHRRESFGPPLREMCNALIQIANSLGPEGVHLVCPVHPNPKVRGPVMELLGGIANISLLDPLEYSSLIRVMRHSTLVLTDSGGIQEEAPSFSVPLLVMRDETERLEGVEAGIARLVGTKADSIAGEAIRLLRNPVEYAQMTTTQNPYGDGRAAERIVAALLARNIR